MSMTTRITAAFVFLSALVSWGDPAPSRAETELPQPVIPAEAAARIPPAGRLIAVLTDTQDPDSTAFVIWRLTPTGLVEVFRETTTKIRNFDWIDARTLVVWTPMEEPELTVRWFVDGKLARTATATAADWKLSRGASSLNSFSMDMYVGRGGAVWLESCLSTVEAAEGEVCKRAAWLRVDTTPFATAARRPKGLTAARGRSFLGDPRTLADLPRLPRAPAGVTVVLKRLKIQGEKARGFECRSAGKVITWPYGHDDWRFDIEPDTVQWLHAMPPLFAVEGKSTNPVGWVSRRAEVFRACQQDAMRGFRWLGAGMWAEKLEHWTLFVDAQPIAVLDGTELAFEAAPL